MSDNKIHKPKTISGFPEWLPEYRAVELEWMDKIRKVFESYGFCNIETPSVEEIDALLAKGGDTEKEIYTIGRLHGEENPALVNEMFNFYLKKGKSNPEAQDAVVAELAKFYAHRLSDEEATTKAKDQTMASLSPKEARLALHFDLTVPMARYVAQHFGNLTFPFKRYQMQKSWRGERPQKGRYREFYQCDIDVVNIDDLPLHFDAELPAVLFEAYQALDIPPVELRISNRKIIMGFLNGLGINEPGVITRTLDKLDKIGADGVLKMLATAGVPDDIAQKALAFVNIKTPDSTFAEQVKSLGVTSDLLTEGLNELTFVTDNLKHLPKGGVIADLGIIRGLDYYTGTVVEARFREGNPMAIGGGGRYDDLASSFINQKLPGIGVSIGLTRLFGLLMDQGAIKPGQKAPTQVLVVLPEESRRAEVAATTQTLRAKGLNVEMYHRDAKIKTQLAYAEKKGIPYVWFPPFKDGQPHEVKNMLNGNQAQADAASWKP